MLPPRAGCAPPPHRQRTTTTPPAHRQRTVPYAAAAAFTITLPLHRHPHHSPLSLLQAKLAPTKESKEAEKEP